MTTKQYDRAYFDKWYRSRAHRVSAHAEVRRKVSMAVAIAEYFLRRPVENVLDVGCGEGAWFTHLRALRPRIAYTGVDPSDYVVQRYGKERNIRKAAFGDLAALRLSATYDLVVCADVLHYVGDREIRRGVREIVRVAGGVVYLEVLTKEDDVVGDLEAFHHRPAEWYRSVFTRARLAPVGPYAWLAPALHASTAHLEVTL